MVPSSSRDDGSSGGGKAGAASDQHPDQRLADTLGASDARLQVALSAAGAGVWESTPATGEFWASDQASALYGLAPGTPLNHDLALEAVHPDDRPLVEQALRDTLETGKPFQIEMRALAPDGSVRWLSSTAHIRGGDPHPRLIGLVMDVTERKQREEYLELLMHEVSHRAKNMLTLVQAIARRTVASHPEDFIDRFEQRITALAANLDVVVKNDWKAVSLGELIHSQLGPFRDLSPRISIEGPPVEITASAAQTLGMAVHELATNAAKYGALSDAVGRVAINWEVKTDVARERRFLLSWTESGGPPVTKPKALGFGSVVVGRMIRIGFGCDAQIDFAPTGVVWRIDCPGDRVLDAEPTALNAR